MLFDPWIAALVALFLWWFSTGAILILVKYADRRGARAGRVATIAALPMLAAGVWGIWETRDLATTGAVYHAFLSALAIWGWIEMAFLTGTITGPNRHVLPPRVAPWERFIRAWGTIAYHEILLAGTTAALVLYCWEAANPYGFLTFALLFGARVSAKLNLFLGVPKINTEFLPAALGHLPSHFRIGPVNWLFPISITGLTLTALVWLWQMQGAVPPDLIGLALLAAMTALALLEHWFMVMPLPDEKLWRWMLPAPKPLEKKTRTEDAHGL